MILTEVDTTQRAAVSDSEPCEEAILVKDMSTRVDLDDGVIGLESFL